MLILVGFIVVCILGRPSRSGSFRSGQRSVDTKEVTRDGRDDLPVAFAVPLKAANPETHDVPESRIPARLNHFAGLPGEEAETVSVLLVRQWTAENPAAASAWASALSQNMAIERRCNLLCAVAVEWADSAPLAAATWARQMPSPAERNSILLTVAEEAVRTDPIAALNIASELPSTPQRDELFSRAVLEWAIFDGEAASKWTAGIADGCLRDRLLAQAAIGWSETDPASAASVAATALAPSRAQCDAIASIVNRWAQVDPQAATDWVRRFPPGSLKEDATAGLTSILALRTAATTH